jgi:hypothetical protein
MSTRFAHTDIDAELLPKPLRIGMGTKENRHEPIRAMEQIRRMRGGSQPHLMRCSDGRNHDLYYIVKFQNNPQHSRILVNELLGTRLASLMGLPTPSTAVVEVGEDLIRYTPELSMELPRSRAPCRPGLQFGSGYPGDPRFVTLFDFLPCVMLRQVKNLHEFAGMVAFDKWACNTDGRQVVFVQRGKSCECVMIDQGFCFNSGEWNFPDAPLIGRYHDTVVYDGVHNLDSFEPWLTRLESKIDATSIFAASQGIPPEWYGHDTAALTQLLERLDTRRKRVRELLWSMSRALPRPFVNWTRPFESRGADGWCASARAC